MYPEGDSGSLRLLGDECHTRSDEGVVQGVVERGVKASHAGLELAEHVFAHATRVGRYLDGVADQVILFHNRPETLVSDVESLFLPLIAFPGFAHHRARKAAMIRVHWKERRHVRDALHEEDRSGRKDEPDECRSAWQVPEVLWLLFELHQGFQRQDHAEMWPFVAMGSGRLEIEPARGSRVQVRDVVHLERRIHVQLP